MRYEDHLAKMKLLQDEIDRLRRTRLDADEIVSFLVDEAETLLRAAGIIAVRLQPQEPKP